MPVCSATQIKTQPGWQQNSGDGSPADSNPPFKTRGTKQRHKVKLDRSSSFPRKWEPAVVWRASYQQGEIREMSLF